MTKLSKILTIWYVLSMLLFLFLSNLKERGYITMEIDKLFFPLVILGFLSLILFGWIEIYVLKGMQKEIEIGFELSPPYKDMRDKINKIYESTQDEKIL